MAKLITDLAKFRSDNKDVIIGATFSCWDLMHAGHMLFLEDCKSQSGIVCVGLQSDPTLDRPEKNKPIQSLDAREIQVKSCRYIDYYFMYDTEKSLYESIIALKPDIRFLGDDYIGKTFTGSDLPCKIVFHPRSIHTYSTTNMRNLIFDRELAKRKLKHNNSIGIMSV